jgi:hypothetical protein
LHDHLAVIVEIAFQNRFTECRQAYAP